MYWFSKASTLRFDQARTLLKNLPDSTSTVRLFPLYKKCVVPSCIRLQQYTNFSGSCGAFLASTYLQKRG